MCQFNYLAPGKKVEIDTQTGTRCTNCSSAAHYTGPAVYNGHAVNGSMVIDAFSITGLWICSGCGSAIYEYIEPCHDYGELVELPACVMELAI